jgi:hypothetical protein
MATAGELLAGSKSAVAEGSDVELLGPVADHMNAKAGPTMTPPDET